MRFISPYLLAVLLAGCVEARERQIAQCRIEATKGLSWEQVFTGQHTAHMHLCMRAAGYEFDESLSGCRTTEAGTYRTDLSACYQPAVQIERALHKLELWLRRS
jgi:hypothetical protein